MLTNHGAIMPSSREALQRLVVYHRGKGREAGIGPWFLKNGIPWWRCTLCARPTARPDLVGRCGRCKGGDHGNMFILRR